MKFTSEAEVMNGDFGIPKGCVVRNTFLEWQEYEVESTKDGNSGSGTDESEASPVRLYPDPDARSLRRCQSCPPETPEAYSNYITSKEQGLRRARTVELTRQEDEAKLLTATRLQKWGDSHSDGQKWGDDSGSEEEDIPAETMPWSTKGRRENSDQGKWNEPTSFSGKSPKSKDSRRDSERRDFDDRKEYSGKGSGKKGRDRDNYDSFGTGSKNSTANTLVLRGLPFSTTTAEVYNFIVECGCKQWIAQTAKPISLVENVAGRPSGYAEITLAKHADFAEVRAKIHLQYFGQRYVEVMPQKSEFGLGNGRSHGNDKYGSRYERERRERRDDRTTRDSWRR
jgi:hypothetical protein